MTQTQISKKYPTIGVCGLDCGLCPRYYTKGTSRCPGCAGPDFFNKHPSCSFITCCVRKKNLEVCSECLEFPCSKFRSNEEYQQLKESSSYPSYKKVIPNLNFVKVYRIEKFVEQQKKRMKILEIMLKDFDDGKSKNFFCKATILIDLAILEKSLDEATRRIKTEKIKQNDIKIKAKILKEILNEVGFKQI